MYLVVVLQHPTQTSDILTSNFWTKSIVLLWISEFICIVLIFKLVHPENKRIATCLLSFDPSTRSCWLNLTGPLLLPLCWYTRCISYALMRRYEKLGRIKSNFWTLIFTEDATVSLFWGGVPFEAREKAWPCWTLWFPLLILGPSPGGANCPSGGREKRSPGAKFPFFFLLK